jgi:hypothetical protein
MTSSPADDVITAPAQFAGAVRIATSKGKPVEEKLYQQLYDVRSGFLLRWGWIQS